MITDRSFDINIMLVPHALTDLNIYIYYYSYTSRAWAWADNYNHYTVKIYNAVTFQLAIKHVHIVAIYSKSNYYHSRSTVIPTSLNHYIIVRVEL